MDDPFHWLWTLLVMLIGWLWSQSVFFAFAAFGLFVMWGIERVIKDAVQAAVSPVLNEISETLREISDKLDDRSDNSEY